MAKRRINDQERNNTQDGMSDWEHVLLSLHILWKRETKSGRKGVPQIDLPLKGK